MVDQKLLDYIKSAITSGRPVDQIKTSLVGKGWSERDIEEVISMAEGTGENSGKSHKTVYIAGLLIIILIIAATGIYIFSILPGTVPPPADKCGNNVCDTGETYETCPSDCERPVGPTGPITVSVIPASKSVNNGDTFTLEVKASGAADFFGFQFDVEYNPSVLEFQSLEQGTFLNRNGQDNTFCVDHKVNASIGLVKNIACTRLGKGSVEGEGVLEKITFKAKAAGTSQIRLSKVAMANSKAESIEAIVANGEVKVS